MYILICNMEYLEYMEQSILFKYFVHIYILSIYVPTYTYISTYIHKGIYVLISVYLHIY